MSGTDRYRKVIVTRQGKTVHTPIMVAKTSSKGGHDAHDDTRQHAADLDTAYTSRPGVKPPRTVNAWTGRLRSKTVIEASKNRFKGNGSQFNGPVSFNVDKLMLVLPRSRRKPRRLTGRCFPEAYRNWRGWRRRRCFACFARLTQLAGQTVGR